MSLVSQYGSVMVLSNFTTSFVKNGVENEVKPYLLKNGEQEAYYDE
jgi:hypothetical protein